MFFLRQTVLFLGLLLTHTTIASSYKSVSDSLQTVLAHTADPAARVALLLNLKDLNEDNELNLPYSIQLFREAAAIGDTYAMSVAINPIISRYASYAEKADSLHYYILTLRQMTPGTPEQGVDQMAEMAIAFNRMFSLVGRERRLRTAHEALRWCDSLSGLDNDIYSRAKILLIQGLAKSHILYYEQGVQQTYVTQIGPWKEAFELTRQMPVINIRKNFAVTIYYLLSGAYNQARRYDDQVALTNDYIRMLDSYYADERLVRRRPYLYADNSYVLPCQQIMRCAINIGRQDLCEKHFREFRERMLNAKGEELLRNKGYLYEMAYLWKGIDKEYDLSIQYSDSLTHLIENGCGTFSNSPGKVLRIYRDQARILYLAGRYDASGAAYEKAMHVQDSIFNAERTLRAETISRSHEMDRMKLDETRNVIRNRMMFSITFVAIGLLVVAIGLYLYRALQRNRRLQADILRHNRKAQESERMKSTFINTICRGIGPPMDVIDRSVQELMTVTRDSQGQDELQTAIRDNTRLLLSTLDNMLEAANLDSLSERLELTPTDIDELCRAEVLAASRLPHNPGVRYVVEAPGSPCIVPTHAKYFSFVIRALLDNAGKFTRQGSITLEYQLFADQLQVSVTDTGCGIPPEKHAEIFRPFCAHTAASQGLSLALCTLIAERLSGTIRLDEQYNAGARFIFSIAVRP